MDTEPLLIVCRVSKLLSSSYLFKVDGNLVSAKFMGVYITIFGFVSN